LKKIVISTQNQIQVIMYKNASKRTGNFCQSSYRRAAGENKSFVLSHQGLFSVL